MHAAVRRSRVRDIDALVSKVEDEFADRVKEIDGFVGYYVIDGGRRNCGVGDRQRGAAQAVAESRRLAGDWVRESASELVEGEPRGHGRRGARARGARRVARPAAIGHAAGTGSRSRSTKPGLGLHPLEPRFHVRVLTEVDLGVGGAMHIGVQGNVRNAVGAARHELATIG